MPTHMPTGFQPCATMCLPTPHTPIQLEVPRARFYPASHTAALALRSCAKPLDRTVTMTDDTDETDEGIDHNRCKTRPGTPGIDSNRSSDSVCCSPVSAD